MITSTANSKIKNFRLLQKAKERRHQELFVIEGLKEIEKATTARYELVTAFYCPDLISESQVRNTVSNCELVEVNRKVYNHIAYREDSGGLIVWAKPRDSSLEDLRVSDSPLLLILESVEKPGNLGALLRTADAASVDAVIVCDPQTDIYNPNVVRSSIGCLFTVPVVVAEAGLTVDFLKGKNVNIYCAALTASKPYHEIDFTLPSAIVMGTESTGLSDFWLTRSDQNIIIPMRGIADSMNVSTSAAVIVFEAIRQRFV